MFSRILRKKRVFVGATIATLALAGGAFAYFTSSGTGTGTATVGSATSWTVGETVHISGGPLYPDATIGTGHIETDQYKVANGPNPQTLTSVEIKVAEPNGSPWSSQANGAKPACNAGDFSVGEKAVGTTDTDTSLAGPFTSGQEKYGTVTVQLIDNGANQDNCQGVTVPLYFYAS
jgi:hypothetical protein